MFKRLVEPSRKEVAFRFNGEPVRAYAGDTIAAALLASGHVRFRSTPVTGSDRGPLCLMGVCFDCLVDVNGKRQQQACMIQVEDGMEIVSSVPETGA